MWIAIAKLNELAPDKPAAAVVDGNELVVVRRGDAVHVLSGRCAHRAALLAEHGVVEGDCLVCSRHGWDFRLDSGQPPQGGEGLAAFPARIDPEGTVSVELEQVRAHARAHPPAFHDDEDVK